MFGLRAGSLRSVLAVLVVGTSVIPSAGAAPAREGSTPHEEPLGLTAITTQDLTGALEPADLAGALAGGGVAISNVTYTGADVAAGVFTGGAGIVGFDSGIVLSSGNMNFVVGPNEFDNVGASNGTDGDPDLDALAAGTTFDAAVLEFDFVPIQSEVHFEYVFASDEYNEWVNTEFNDVFGFFVNGENCATVGGDPVSVNTINNGNPFDTDPRSHPELYINNDLDNGGGSIDTEMDGLTVVLSCDATVTPGVTNHIKLAIADTGDSILDANVFIAAGTFASGEPINFYAGLSGSADLAASGDPAGVAGIGANDAGTALDYTLVTFGLQDITAAHVHCASGAVGITLFAGGPVTRDGILAAGSVTAPDPGNGCGWADLAAALEEMRDETTYVNVHTVAQPDGAIVGTLAAAPFPTPPVGTFTDDDTDIHEGNIEAIAAFGITRGCNPPANDQYCPSDPITRGQMAAFLARTFNLPESTTDHFTDDAAHIFEGDINAIADVGITKGCNPPANDAFCPDDPVTREQMASFIVRALALTAGAGDDLFTDDDGSVHEANIDVLGTAGITLGCNPPANDRYCPTDPVLRNQMASFFARFLELRAMPPD